MPHRSTIRKTALSLIYALLEQKCEDMSSFPLAEFWEIALEKENAHLQQALTKAVLHVCRSIGDLAAPVLERGKNLAERAPNPELNRLLSATESLLHTHADLCSAVQDARRNATQEPGVLTKKILYLAGQIDEKSAIFLNEPTTPHTAPFHAALRRWQKVLRECAALENPTHLGDHVEYSGLIDQARKLAALRPQAEELAIAAYERRAEWEETLDRLLRNYIPQRLDTLDRSILYLSLYELKYRKLRAAIVISEANNLAHEFSGVKSSPFVHGVLAAAVEELSPDA